MAEYPIQPGPCVVCGRTNYALAGGPTICPPCDCGESGYANTIRAQKAELDAVRAERDEARQLAEQRSDSVWTMAERAAALRARAAQLEAALRKYGSHLGPCDKFALRNGACTCGLDAALAASPAREDVVYNAAIASESGT